MQKVVVPPPRLKALKSPTTTTDSSAPSPKHVAKKTSHDELSNKCDTVRYESSKGVVVDSVEKISYTPKESSRTSSILFNDKAISAVTITVTSPEGINKSILKRERSFKKSSRVKLNGIPTSKSDFWLPSIPVVPVIILEKSNICRDKQEDTDVPKASDEAISTPTMGQLKCIIVEMYEAMKLHDFQFVENKQDILHACKTVDDKWLAVSKNSIMCFREISSSFCCVSIQDIASIWVDVDYLLISFELVPESEIGLIEAIPGEADKTESLISSVMFASSRQVNKCTRMSAIGYQPELRIKRVTELPICTKAMKDIYTGEDVIFSTIAYFETIQSHSEISNEFLSVKKGQMDLAMPVDLKLTGKTLKIHPTGDNITDKNLLDESYETTLNLEEYVISKAQDKDYHIINLHRKSSETCIQLVATNESAFRELMWRLQSVKDSPENAPKQLVYLIVTEQCMCLFSAMKAKKLLMRSLLLNLASIGLADEFSCLITVDGEEMDEVASGKTVWRKITFLMSSQCSLFYEIMKSRVDSNYMTEDF